jgi:hypothetical protein
MLKVLAFYLIEINVYKVVNFTQTTKAHALLGSIDSIRYSISCKRYQRKYQMHIEHGILLKNRVAS